MINVIRGDLWQSTDNLIVVSSHGTLDSDGHLEMNGTGSLSKLATMYPELRVHFGAGISRNALFTRKRSHLFGFVAAYIPQVNRFYGLVQTKLHWKDNPEPGILALGLSQLNSFVGSLGKDVRVSMVYPGIGHRQLTPAELRPMMEQLLTNCEYTVYTKMMV